MRKLHRILLLIGMSSMVLMFCQNYLGTIALCVFLVAIWINAMLITFLDK
jgi:hypothetical protein